MAKRKRHITLGPAPTGPTCSTCVLSGACANGPSDPVGSGFAAPFGRMTNGVMLVTEALDSTEDVKKERALAGRGGFLLARTFARRGWKLDEFRVAPAMFCMPNQPLRGGRPLRLTTWAADALYTCAPNLSAEINAAQPRVIVAFGEVAFTTLTGMEHGMMDAHGYAFRERLNRAWVVPTFDPTWVLLGNQVYAQVILRDVEKALRIAADPAWAFEQPNVLMDPPLSVWEDFVRGYLALPSATPLGTDIETPYKQDVDED